MNNEWSQVAANAIAYAAEKVSDDIRVASDRCSAPSVLYHPRLFIDGDQWCALYGDNLQDGVSGFGKTPEDAMWDFDCNWRKPIGAVMKGGAA